MIAGGTAAPERAGAVAACPECRGVLAWDLDSVGCSGCGRRFRRSPNGVPILTQGRGARARGKVVSGLAAAVAGRHAGFRCRPSGAPVPRPHVPVTEPEVPRSGVCGEPPRRCRDRQCRRRQTPLRPECDKRRRRAAAGSGPGGRGREAPSRGCLLRRRDPPGGSRARSRCAPDVRRTASRHQAGRLALRGGSVHAGLSPGSRRLPAVHRAGAPSRIGGLRVRRGRQWRRCGAGVCDGLDKLRVPGVPRLGRSERVYRLARPIARWLVQPVKYADRWLDVHPMAYTIPSGVWARGTRRG